MDENGVRWTTLVVRTYIGAALRPEHIKYVEDKMGVVAGRDWLFRHYGRRLDG